MNNTNDLAQPKDTAQNSVAASFAEKANETNIDPLNPETIGSGDNDAFEKQKARGWKKRAAGFFSSQAMSMFGSMLVQHAMIFYLTLTYKSGVIMMISMLCGFLPQILVSMFSGVFADRANRKLLIILSDGVIAVSTLILAVIFISGYKELWLLFSVMAIRSLGSGIQSPAVSAFIPQIVPQDKLMKANGINNSIQSIVMLLSPALAGAVLAVASLEIIFFIDVATAFAAVVILLPLRAPDYKKEKTEAGYLDDLKNGIKFVLREKPLRTLMIFWAAFMFLLTPVIFLPSIHIARAFGNEEWRLAISEILFALGALIAGIIISSWGGFKNRLKTLIFGCLLFSVFTVIMGLGTHSFTVVFGNQIFGNTFFFVLFLIAMFFSGVGMSFTNVPGMTLIQEYADPKMHGRVFGLVQIVSASAVPLGSLIFGPLADIINIETMFVFSGLLLILLCVAMIFNKNLKLLVR